MNKVHRGFTLIELSLSLAFISVLAIIIALIASSMTATYQRGLILKQVNTVGNDIIDDIRSAIAGSSSKSVTSLCYTTYSGEIANNCISDNAQSFVNLTRSANVKIRNREEQTQEVPVFGMFCSGTYSYIWNSGYFFSNAKPDIQPVTLKYKYKDVDNDTDITATYPASNDEPSIRLLKVIDPSRAVCASSINPRSNTGNNNNSKEYIKQSDAKNKIPNEIDITWYGYVTEPPIDLLSSDSLNSDLAIYDLTVARPAQDALTQNALYSGSFIVGSIKGGIDIMASGDYCATPTDYEIEDFNYCAINKFNFAIRATGE